MKYVFDGWYGIIFAVIIKPWCRLQILPQSGNVTAFFWTKFSQLSTNKVVGTNLEMCRNS